MPPSGTTAQKHPPTTPTLDPELEPLATTESSHRRVVGVGTHPQPAYPMSGQRRISADPTAVHPWTTRTELLAVTEPYARYGRLYAALAPTSIVLSFLPPFAVGGPGLNARTESFGTVWDMASTPGGDPARAAMVLLAALFCCLLAAAVWPAVAALPVVNGVCASAVGVLLWTRPATGNPPPDLSAVGKAHLTVAAAIVATSVIHLSHLLHHHRRGHTPPPPPDGAGHPRGPDTNTQLLGKARRCRHTGLTSMHGGAARSEASRPPSRSSPAAALQPARLPGLSSRAARGATRRDPA